MEKKQDDKGAENPCAPGLYWKHGTRKGNKNARLMCYYTFDEESNVFNLTVDKVVFEKKEREEYKAWIKERAVSNRAYASGRPCDDDDDLNGDYRTRNYPSLVVS